jgi:hypothetical protein
MRRTSDTGCILSAMETCSIDGCGQRPFGHGWCNKHYKRWRKYGDPLALKGKQGPPPRFQGGERIGRLAVVEQAPKVRRGRDWLCRCDCGTEIIVTNENLGRCTFSCGCLQKERFEEQRHSGDATRTHGMYGTPTYNSWTAMRARCYRRGCNGYKNYGGRGITVCERWRSSFENFLADMGERPDGMTLDRINVEGNYEPGNCRWATKSEQRKNVRKANP